MSTARADGCRSLDHCRDRLLEAKELAAVVVRVLVLAEVRLQTLRGLRSRDADPLLVGDYATGLLAALRQAGRAAARYPDTAALFRHGLPGLTARLGAQLRPAP